MTGIHFKHKRASLICNEFYEGIWFFLKFPNRNIYDCFLFCMVKDYMNYWTQFSSLLLELINSNKWMTFIFNFFFICCRYLSIPIYKDSDSNCQRLPRKSKLQRLQFYCCSWSWIHHWLPSKGPCQFAVQSCGGI